MGSSLLPTDFFTNVRRITQSLTVFTALDKFRSMFQIVLVGFFFLFSLPIFFITILVSLLLTERIISPITHLEDATRRVAEGDFGFRILTRSRDELATLVDSFNGMISELERSRRQLVQAEDHRVAGDRAAPGPRDQEPPHADQALRTEDIEEARRKGSGF